MQSKNAIGNLISRYKAVLKKCHVLNTLGSLALITTLTSTLSVASVCMPQTAHAVPVDTNIVTIEEVQTGPNYYTTYTGVDGKNYGVIFEDSNSANQRTSSLTDLILRSGAKASATSAGTDWQIVQGTTGPTFTIGGTSFTVAQGDGITALTSTNQTLAYPLPNTITDDFYLRHSNHIYLSSGTVATIDSNFIGNTGGEGAGINIEGGTITTINSNFIGNKVFDVGGPPNESGAAINIEGGTIGTIESNFIGNSAQRSGGAINVDGIVDMIRSNFIGNSSLSTSSNEGGGALQVLKTINTISSNFIANTANSVGGAIYTRNNLNFVADNNIHIFTGNKDKSGYNAIYVDRTSYGSTPAEVSLDFNMQGNGGFIINDSIRGDYSRLNGHVTEIDPTVTDVYDFTITGENAANNVFYFNNEATKVKAFSLTKANLSLGTVTQGGDTSHGSISAQSATFAGDSILTLNADSYTTNAAIQSSGSAGTLTVEAGAQLQIANGTTGDTIHVASGFTNSSSSIAAGAWDGDNLTSTSSLQWVKVEDFDPAKGSYSVKIDKATPSDLRQIYPNMSQETADFVVNFDASNKNSYFVQILDTPGGKDPDAVTRSMEGGLRLAHIADVQARGIDVASGFAANVLRRFGKFGATGSKPQVQQVPNDATTSGMPAGSEISGIHSSQALNKDTANGLALWIAPMYSYSNVQGQEVGAYTNSYTSSAAGLTLGADYTFEEIFRVGLAFNVGAGYTESTGDFFETINDFDFWGLSLYGGIQKDNFSLMADVGVNSVFGEVSQDTISGSGWSSLKASTQTIAWTAGLTASYTFETDFLDVTPHAGVRYMNITTDGFDMTSNGIVQAHTEKHSQDVWYFPVGVTLSKDFESASGWTFTPTLDVGFVAAAGDLEAHTTTTAPGVIGSVDYSMQNVDGFAFNGGLGFDLAHKDNGVSFGLNYNIQTSEHETAHMLNAVFRFEF